MSQATYTEDDRLRALHVYQLSGFTAATNAGPWSRATVRRWVNEEKGIRTLRKPEKKKVAVEKPRPGFPDLGPIPKRPFDPDEVCRSQARAQLVNLT